MAAEKMVPLTAVVKNDQALVRMVQQHTLRLATLALERGISLDDLAKAIEDGDNEFLQRHFRMEMLGFEVSLTSHHMLTRMGMAIGRPSDRPSGDSRVDDGREILPRQRPLKPVSSSTLRAP